MTTIENLITLEQLRNVVNAIKEKFAKKDVAARFMSVILGRSSNNNISDGYSISDAGTDGIQFAQENGGTVNLQLPESGNYTVATCENSSQNIDANSVYVNDIVPKRIVCDNNKFIALPGTELPDTYSETDTNFAGTVLTTMYRPIAQRVYNQRTILAPAADVNPMGLPTYQGDDLSDFESLTALKLVVPVQSGVYYMVTGYNVQFTFNQISAVEAVDTWILMHISSNNQPDAISITFEQTNLKWLTPQPAWKEYDEYYIQIHILGNTATVTGYFNANPSGLTSSNSPAESDNISSGSLREAVSYGQALENADRNFQWLLIDRDAAGNAVRKPIWHISKGTFVDAIGSIVTLN